MPSIGKEEAPGMQLCSSFSSAPVSLFTQVLIDSIAEFFLAGKFSLSSTVAVVVVVFIRSASLHAWTPIAWTIPTLLPTIRSLGPDNQPAEA